MEQSGANCAAWRTGPPKPGAVSTPALGPAIFALICPGAGNALAKVARYGSAFLVLFHLLQDRPERLGISLSIIHGVMGVRGFPQLFPLGE